MAFGAKLVGMDLLFTGAGGQVGRALSALAPGAVALSRADVDLAGSCDLSVVFSTPPARPSVLINLAAFTGVDAAEDAECAQEVELVNAIAPGKLAHQCRELGIPMIQVSTDYAFSGRRAVGEDNHPADPVDPINAYGRSKLAGEQAALEHGATVVRTSWVYTGPENTGKDFVKTMAHLAATGVGPAVVDDQWGRPTYAPHLAAGLLEVARALAGEHETVRAEDVPPVLHCAGSGDPITWFDLARATFAATGHDKQRVSCVPTAEYPTPAARPLNATLSVSEWAELGLRPLPAWQEGLRQSVE